MPRTNIAAQALAPSIPYYPAVPLAGGSADLVMTATDDPTDRDTALVNGKTVVLAENTDTGAHTITIGSSPDTYNRSGDISAYSIAAGKIARFGPFLTTGWANSGRLNIDISSPLIRLAIITLP